MVMAVILGSIIGYERREAERPAGIRTMGLVSLASCLFTINAVFAFLIGPPLHWDPTMVPLTIPSAVGFLGAGLIVKYAETDELTGEKRLVVIGFHTANSIWLSAAVGVACGGGMYFVATFTAALVLVLLRFGPRQLHREDLSLGLPHWFDGENFKNHRGNNIKIIFDGNGAGLHSRRNSSLSTYD